MAGTQHNNGIDVGSAGRSEEAQEVIEQESGFIEKWALWIMLGILLLIGAAAGFIHFPDIVQVRAKLTSLTAVKDIVPAESGRITRLFVQNGSSVTRGEIIAYLESAADTGKVKNVIAAPVDGVLYFTRPLQPNQYIQQGGPVAYVAPNDNQLFAELYLPQSDLGRVFIGMPVQLRFDAYPYQENGLVEGKLDYISGIISDSGCLATVSLYHGLVTSNHQRLQFKVGLKADALIITRDMSLLKRIRNGIGPLSR